MIHINSTVNREPRHLPSPTKATLESQFEDLKLRFARLRNYCETLEGRIEALEDKGSESCTD